MTVPYSPMRIPGAWREGYVLDYHSKRSDFLGYDQYGHPRFRTDRTEVGELLYRLKYNRQEDALAELVTAGADFIRRWNPPVDVVVPVPPSKARASQPVLRLATGISDALQIPLADVVKRAPGAKQLKNVFEFHERMRLLENAHNVVGNEVREKCVLVVDDLFRSGATLNAVTEALRDTGRASAVYAFALTRTRSKA